MNCKGWADTQEGQVGKVCFQGSDETCSLSCISSSLGSRPAVLRAGEREAWASLVALAWDRSPSGSMSARRSGGKFLIKTMWLEEKGKNRNHAWNVGHSRGWKRRWIKIYEKDTGGQKASNVRLLKTTTSLLLTEYGKFLGICSHLVFWPWTYTLTLCVCVCVCAEQLKKEGRRPNKSMLQIHNKFLLYIYLFSL